jgi:hypothetical protein
MRALYFSYVWPEPRSSAAGIRSRDFVEILRESGFEVGAVSPSGLNEYSEEWKRLGIPTFSCPANDEGAFAQLLTLPAPDLIVFDRFVMEEQFGWRCREAWPAARHCVDTQDLHSVRRYREKEGAEEPPKPLALGPDFLRETASLLRADASLVVSAWERDWLLQQLPLLADRLFHLPLIAEPEKSLPPFAERRGYCFLGNFRHPPNLDAARFLVDTIWPKIREQEGNAELTLCGAYPPALVSAWHGRNGIRVKGNVADHRAELARHRVLLAPLRFGAGTKGKVLEAWACGLTVVGTAHAFEGMSHHPGVICPREEFPKVALAAHADEAKGEERARRGLCYLEEHFSRAKARKIWQEVEEAIGLTTLRESGRVAPGQLRNLEAELVSRILRHAHHNSTKYFSRWIAAKNKAGPRPAREP